MFYFGGNMRIIFTAISMVIACNKMNSPANEIESTSSNYTVTFDGQFSNDGNITVMPNPISMTVASGQTVGTLPSDPIIKDPITKEEKYKFGGWYTGTSASGTKFTESTAVTTDTIVYAYWYKYLVTFYKDSTTTAYAYKGTPPSSPKYINALPTDPTMTGYKFAGWNKMLDGSGDEFFASTEVTSDMNVYAQWASNTDTLYTVTYDSDGGSSVGAQYVDVVSGNTVGTLPPKPVYLCHVFDHWWKAKGGESVSGNTEFKADTPVTANITVYAYWTAQHKVTFNSGWGTAVEPGCVDASTNKLVAALPTQPTKRCYAFKGWYTDTTYTTPFTASTTVTEDITVYAKWDWDYPSETYPLISSPFAIGDPGPSCVGKVFYIEGGGLSGSHGLEAAPPGWHDHDLYADNADPYLPWISGDYYTNETGDLIEKTQITLNGNTSTAMGTGKANSDAIIYQTKNPDTSSSGSAAQFCEEYKEGGGKNDWFLPSKDELAQLYAQRDQTRWGGFDKYSYGYWSSSEYDQSDAWSQEFTNGTQNGTLKSYERRIRPIRAF
jgi:uncharacterized repeat protein (TIGR02543 family)